MRLIDEISRHGISDPFRTFGGGTVLMLRYRHRYSKDIDIFAPDPQYLGHVSPRLSEVAESVSADYVEGAGYVTPRFGNSRLDIIHCLVNYGVMETSLDEAAELRTRDADRTQQTILDAATAEFSEHGLGGARIDGIAERAGVNKRLIYYYFGAKDELFLAVLRRTYAGIRDAERELELASVKPAEAIRRLIAFTWHYYLEHPEFLSLLNTENLCAARHLKDSADIRELNSPLVEWLGQVLERGRREGVFRGGVDPVQLYVSIAGLAYFYLSNKHTLSTIFGRDLMSRKALAERLSHMTEVILGYVLRN